MDDFKPVARLHACFIPERAGQDIEVAFEGDAVAGHPEMIQQRGHGEALGNFASVAVDDHIHCAELADESFARDLMVNRISSFQASAWA